MSVGVTSRQRELLDFISERMATDGVCPSFEEMKEALGLASKSAIHRLLDELEGRGYIARIRGKARCIEVLQEPRPLLRPASARALGQVPIDDILAEMQARGFRVTRVSTGIFCNRVLA